MIHEVGFLHNQPKEKEDTLLDCHKLIFVGSFTMVKLRRRKKKNLSHSRFSFINDILEHIEL